MGDDSDAILAAHATMVAEAYSDRLSCMLPLTALTNTICSNPGASAQAVASALVSAVSCLM